VKELLPNTQLIRLAFALIGILLFSLIICGDALSGPVDTLYLQLQWAYPINIVDMKLVDFNHDGIDEILVGFKSDSSRVGILDAVSQSMVWQSPAFHGAIATVAAGDRDNDGDLDIVVGGQRSDSSIGYIEVFDGPTFYSIHTASGFDQSVISAAISTRFPGSSAQIFLGTYWGRWSGGYAWWAFETGGKLYTLDGQGLTVESIKGTGAVREILLQDINSDTYEELFLGIDYRDSYEDAFNPVDRSVLDCWITELTLDSEDIFYLYDLHRHGAEWIVSFDALGVGNFNHGVSNSIIGSGHILYYAGFNSKPESKLASWNESTTKLEWSIEWNTGSYITGLDICSFFSDHTNVICAAYQNGLIEFRSGTDGSNLAVILPLHSIYHLKLGNVDENPWIEMCVASKDSLYVYRTWLLPRNDAPLVSDIPNQTITEGENFTSINLDDYVTDPDDSDSVMVWSHRGETKLLVDITDRVATVTVPNPEWNGAETIWFKACDPGGLCDSDQAIFTVTAVNDTPVVSDVPDQTIAEGESFTSIHLDDYVTDPDNPDSVMVWSYWGEAGLLVHITKRVATITVPNPEWNGAETIWFKACDPGGLCDSNQAIFTVTAVNDTPTVSDIPDQTIAEGESFTSIHLDDYVTDPDDPDSVMVWSYRGEAGLLVHITDRVAIVTPPNPEWKGVETIWFKACDPGGLCDSSKATFTVIPDRFCLFQNYPNPFNPQTNIRFDVPVVSNVTITIYSILGEKVREFKKRYEAGTHRLMWDGKNSSGEDVASGVYLYKLSAGSYQEIRKMVLIK
jgi:hypothetical protein